MAIIYYPQSSQVLQRTTSGSNYTEVVIATVPNAIFFFDTGSQISSLSASSLSVTASYALSAFSASYAPGNPSLSASWAALALTASYALNGGGSGTTLSTGSTYPITSSWASNAKTASSILITDIGNGNTEYGVVFSSDTTSSALATNGGGTSLFSFNPGTNTLKAGIFFGTLSGSVVGTASQASSASYSRTASYALNGGGSGTTLSTSSTYPITSSWALTASYALNGGASGGSGSTISTGSTYPITSSWAVSARTGSYMTGSNFRIIGNELQLKGTPSGSWFKLEVYEDPLGTGSLQLTFAA